MLELTFDRIRMLELYVMAQTGNMILSIVAGKQTSGPLPIPDTSI